MSRFGHVSKIHEIVSVSVSPTHIFCIGNSLASVLTFTDLSRPRRLNLRHGGDGERPRVVVQLGLVPLGMCGLRRRPGQHLAVSLPLLQGTTNVAVFYVSED